MAQGSLTKQVSLLVYSVAEPDPGSGAFLTPWIWHPGGTKIKIWIQDEHPESYFRELRNNILG